MPLKSNSRHPTPSPATARLTLILSIVFGLWAPWAASAADAPENALRVIDDQLLEDLTKELTALFPGDKIAITLPDTAAALHKTLQTQPCVRPELSHNRKLTLGRTSVQIKCHGKLQWSFYRPVMVEVITQALVAARTLSRDQPLALEDVELISVDRAGLRSGWYARAQDVDGLELARNLRGGQIIYAHHVRRPHAVQRGDSVLIKASSQQLSITSQGEALQSGHPGDQIRVRNLHSQRILSLWVWRKGLVGTRPDPPD